jgi:hypothetical protein
MYEFRTETARYTLVNDIVLRIDEIQTIEPNEMNNAESLVYFRNGKHVVLKMDRETALNTIFE